VLHRSLKKAEVLVSNLLNETKELKLKLATYEKRDLKLVEQENAKLEKEFSSIMIGKNALLEKIKKEDKLQISSGEEKEKKTEEVKEKENENKQEKEIINLKKHLEPNSPAPTRKPPPPPKPRQLLRAAQSSSSPSLISKPATLNHSIRRASRRLHSANYRNSQMLLGSEIRREQEMEKRGYVVKELLTTERNYVRCLEIMISKYKMPLEEAALKGSQSEILPGEAIRSIFGYLDLILNFNQTLLAKLEERIDSWSDKSVIGDIFIELGDLLCVYYNYINNYFEIYEKVKILEETNQKFNKFLQQVAKDVGKIRMFFGYSLESFLITPVQRIPRYKDLLNSALKYTPVFHEDYELLSNAVAKVEKILEDNEVKKKETDQQSKEDNIHNKNNEYHNNNDNNKQANSSNSDSSNNIPNISNENSNTETQNHNEDTKPVSDDHQENDSDNKSPISTGRKGNSVYNVNLTLPNKFLRTSKPGNDDFLNDNNATKIIELTNRFVNEVELQEKKRMFLKEESLMTRKLSKDKTQMKPMKQRNIFLFSDCLVVAKTPNETKYNNNNDENNSDTNTGKEQQSNENNNKYNNENNTNNTNTGKEDQSNETNNSMLHSECKVFVQDIKIVDRTPSSNYLLFYSAQVSYLLFFANNKAKLKWKLLFDKVCDLVENNKI